MLIKDQQTKHLTPFENSNFLACIVEYVLHNATPGSKLALHVCTPDKTGIAAWCSAILQVNLFSNDFFQALDDRGIKKNDLIKIGPAGTSLIARFQHYSKTNRKLTLKLRSGIDELSEEWPLVNPLWINKIENGNRRLSNQRGALQKFRESISNFEPSVIDYILNVETYGNKDIFNHKILLLTKNVGQARNWLRRIEYCGESLGEIACEGTKLVIKNDTLYDIVWTSGDEIKRKIRNSLIDIVVFDQYEKDQLSTELLKAYSPTVLKKVLGKLKTKIEGVQQEGRRERLGTLLQKIYSEVESLSEGVITESIKCIVIDGPDCVVNDPENFVRMIDTGIPVVVFSDSRSLVESFRGANCFDDKGNMLPQFQRVLSRFQVPFDATKCLEGIEKTHKYSDYEVLEKNVKVCKFDIDIKVISTPSSLQKLNKLKNDFFRFRDHSTENNFLKLFYCYVLPTLDFLTNYPNTPTQLLVEFIQHNLQQYKNEVYKDGYYTRYLSEDAKQLGNPDIIENCIQNALADIKHDWGESIKRYIGPEFQIFFSQKNLYHTNLTDKNLINESTPLTSDVSLCYYGLSVRNFRHLIDRCLRKDVNRVLFLGSSEECTYLENRIAKIFSLTKSVLDTSFIGGQTSLTDFIKVRKKIDVLGKPALGAVNIDMYQYLETIHVSMAGITPRTVIGATSEKEINAGVLFLENDQVLYYPLEGSKFFALSEDNLALKLDRLQHLRARDYLIWIPEVQQTIKRIIQEALQFYNADAYKIIYEWRLLLEGLNNFYGGVYKLAMALINGNLTQQTVSQLRMNLHRWLDSNSDTWMPVDENMFMIYKLSEKNGLCQLRDITARINLAKRYMLEASKIRVSIRNEIKNKLEDHLTLISTSNNFSIHIQGHDLRVCSYKVFDNNIQGILIDSSQIYKVIAITE